jgi:hypothetical protein
VQDIDGVGWYPPVMSGNARRDATINQTHYLVDPGCYDSSGTVTGRRWRRLRWDDKRPVVLVNFYRVE